MSNRRDVQSSSASHKNEETSSESSGSSSPVPFDMNQNSDRSLTLREFVEGIEQQFERTVLRLQTLRGRRRPRLMPVYEPGNPNHPNRFDNHGDEIVEDVVAGVWARERRSTGGILEFNVIFADDTSALVNYHFGGI